MQMDIIEGLEFDLLNASKSTAERIVRFHTIYQGLAVGICEGLESEEMALEACLPAGLIQFTMSSEGQGKMQFGPHYAQDLASNQCMLLYNPSMDLKYQYSFKKGDKTVFIFCTVEHLHRLLIDEGEQVGFLSESNIGQKYYDKSPMSPQLRLCMDSLYSTNISSLSERMFLTGKAMELLSFYFDTGEEADYTEKCPFLKDQRNVDAVRKSKELLLENMIDPPTIKDLSIEVGLNESQLKQGFKNIYGNTIHAYLVDHKLDHALRLMVNERVKVQEAAGAIGYSNPSHFIAAFKKKFGVTPKQYMMGRN